MSLTKVSYSMIQGAPVNVLDFGADPTGSSSNQAAIVAALATSDAVYFPAGTYLVDGNINIQGKSISGEARYVSIIELAGSNTNTPVFVNSATSSDPWGSGEGCEIRDLTIKGNWDGSTPNPIAESGNFATLGSIVKWYQGSYVQIINCKIQDSFAHGVAFYGLGYSQIQFNEITTNKYSGVYLLGPNSSTDAITSTWVSNNSIHSCRGVAAIYLSEGLTCQITQNVLEDCTNGFYVDGNDNRTVSFCFNDMEQMSASGVNIQGTGTQFNVSNNFLGVTTPITIANSLEFREGVFTNNSFSTIDYATSFPTLGSGATSNTAFNFFGLASNNTAPGIINFKSNNNFNANTPIARIAAIHDGSVNQLGGALAFGTANNATNTFADRLYLSGTGILYPAVDNTQSLGAAGNRWSVVYAGTGTINTSDANEKTEVRPLEYKEKAVALAIKARIKAFKFKDAVEEKGALARIHFGILAQDVKEAFEAEQLDAEKYGVFCSDTWYEFNGLEVKPDEEGIYPQGAIKKTRLGVRYDELFAFIIGSI